MSNENENLENPEVSEISADENSEKPISTESEQIKPFPDPDNISGLLGEPTEEKPEFWEQKEKINENLPEFDSPPAEESVVINPDKILKKPTSKNVISKGSKLAAPIVVEVIDSIIPPVINMYAKSENYERFCADDDAKESLSEALADLMGSQDVELSPTWTFILALLAAYAPALVDAYELRRAHEKIAKQEKEINQYKATIDEKERENKRLIIEADKKEQEALEELNELRLKNAELGKKAAAAELEAKRISVKEVKPKKTTKTTKSKIK